MSFLSSLCRGVVKVDKPGMKGLRYVTRPKNSWEFGDVCGHWQGVYCIDLSWVQMNTIGIIEAAKEVDGLSLYVCFLWIKHQIIFEGNLHEVLEVDIMFCLSVAMDSDVICDSDKSLALFEDLVHLLLEDVLGADKAKGKSQEAGSFQRAC